MPLQPGARLGPYHIVSPLGVGGMGEVYRATDTNLKRAVAIKVLPESVARDAERLARFQREAEILAALNHPNIAHIYGLEGRDGRDRQEGQTGPFLVMELVEGPTLADRLARGPIPVGDAVAIGKQIAEALEAAHEQGIIHRDLKPANIKVREDGTVKVLDFGLAKAIESPGALSASASMSPTITTPAMTQAGMILGTAAYMAPEQARGKAVDKRADIWAFGCVLYEMLTGARAFDGDDVTVVLASIIKSDPEWKALPVDTPPPVRNILRGCLQKDPKQRVRDIGDVRLALEGAFDPTAGVAVASQPAAHPIAGWRGALPLAAALLVGSVVTGLAAWAILGSRGDPPSPSVRRFEITLPDPDQLPGGTGTLVAISPDGQTLVYRARRNGMFRLYRRAMNQLEATPIGDVDAGESPFFSPDGQWIGFHVGTTLKKVSASGGPSQTLAELPGTPRGASWGPDGTIIIGFNGPSGLMRLPAAGGTPERVATPDGARRLWYPQLLPGGRAVLFTSSEPTPDTGELEILRLDTGERKKLLPGSAGRYLPTGHLVFVRSGTLWAVGFDLSRLAVAGTPVPAVEGVRVESAGAVQFAVADDGSLSYLPAAAAQARRLVWLDRSGREEPIDAPPRGYFLPRLSPDGTRLAVEVRDQENDIWTWDLVRQTLTRLTFDPAVDAYPAWTRDGRRVIFSSAREKILAPFWQAADGIGTAERLGTDPRALDQASLSLDGKRLILRAASPDTGEDIVMLSMESDRRIEPLLHTKFTERNAELSPDGRWIAYQSNESGAFEVYVRPFPQVEDGRWQISAGSGFQPLWSRNGPELFFVTADGALMSVPVQPSVGFTMGNATRVLDVSSYTVTAWDWVGRSYDVSPDGERFVLIKEEQQPGAARINVVLNWTEELKQLVPTTR